MNDNAGLTAVQVDEMMRQKQREAAKQAFTPWAPPRVHQANQQIMGVANAAEWPSSMPAYSGYEPSQTERMLHDTKVALNGVLGDTRKVRLTLMQYKDVGDRLLWHVVYAIGNRPYEVGWCPLEDVVLRLSAVAALEA